MGLVEPRPYRKSSFSANGNCVEVAAGADGTITIRDSKSPVREEQHYTPDEWVAFVRGVKAGEFDFGLVTDHADRHRPWSARLPGRPRRGRR